MEAQCRAQSGRVAVVRLCQQLLLRLRPRRRLASPVFSSASNKRISEKLPSLRPQELGLMMFPSCPPLQAFKPDSETRVALYFIIECSAIQVVAHAHG